MRFKTLFYNIVFIVGSLLLIVNVYGLSQNIRVDDFDNQYLRFTDDQPQDFDTTIVELIRNQDENEIDYATRITKVVARGISHIEWLNFPPEKFNQLIPIWENYFIYFMGIFSGIPEYQRYHFANYHRSLERGIGLCGDASMVISQLLDEQSIQNKILTFPGHVVVLAFFANGRQFILDGDFGIVAPYSLAEVSDKSNEIAQLYVDAGYTQGDYRFIRKMLQKKSRQWDGVQHFITNKYYFEKVSYWLKWPTPFFLILFSIYMIRKLEQKNLNKK
ncbi:MAG: hypothetical protein ACI9LE_000469 [Paraglaciecola sp.]